MMPAILRNYYAKHDRLHGRETGTGSTCNISTILHLEKPEQPNRYGGQATDWKTEEWQFASQHRWDSLPRPSLLPTPVLPTRCRHVLSRLQSGLSVKLTSYLHVAPMLRLGGAIPPLPHMPSWRVQRQLHSLNEVKLRVLWAHSLFRRCF